MLSPPAQKGPYKENSDHDRMTLDEHVPCVERRNGTRSKWFGRAS
jgi:hypothetical protein